MNKINKFFENAPMWQIYIFGWISTGTFVASIFYGFQFIGAAAVDINLSLINCIKMGAMTGLLLGLMIMFMISMMRKSRIFWDYSKVVGELIEKAETKETLQSIFDNEFQDLRKKCQGGPQIPEITRLYAVMITKFKYIN
jgi:hypothetical protein